MSTVFHPETDDSSERTNKTVNQCLRYHVTGNQTAGPSAGLIRDHERSTSLRDSHRSSCTLAGRRGSSRLSLQQHGNGHKSSENIRLPSDPRISDSALDVRKHELTVPGPLSSVPHWYHPRGQVCEVTRSIDRGANSLVYVFAFTGVTVNIG